MNTVDVVKMAGTVAVLGAQMGVPLWFAWREFNTPTAPKVARKVTRTNNDVANLPTLAPLRCPSCKAPVPLLAKQFPCPHCAAPVVPPADYVNALVSRSKSDALLKRAERMWRRSRIVCARPTTFLMTLFTLAWTGLVIASSVQAFHYGLPELLVALPCIIAVVQCFLGFFLISVIGDGRKSLPRLPTRAELRVPAAQGTCTGCGGPFMFEKDRLASTCRYCGAENFRAALAQKARVHEANSEFIANLSMVAQIKEHDARRHETLGFFVIIGVAEVFYGALLPIGWVMSALGF